MTINDLETLQVVVSKRVLFNLTEQVDLIQLVNDVEDYYNKPLSKISTSDVIKYIKDYIFDDGVMEDILMGVFPEIDFE